MTTLPAADLDARAVQQHLHAALGDTEDRIKALQLVLFAVRTSGAAMRANQAHHRPSTFAYVLVAELRRIRVVSTELPRAHVRTIRTHLIEICAQVCLSVR